MKFIGFNFKKMKIERTSDFFQNLKISTNINISKITKPKINPLKEREELITVEFNYFIDYSPNVARIEFVGEVLFTTDLKQSKEILKDWKSKKISNDFKIMLFNIILRKSNIKALQLEDEMNLPPHISLPSLKREETKN